LTKVGKIHGGEKVAFNKWCWENWIPTFRRLKLDPYFSPCTKIDSKYIKDLHVRAKI
jgi:hypothetical protein